MYSLGLTLLPADYERWLAEDVDVAREMFASPTRGGEEDPFVLEPLTVTVTRTSATKAGLVALYLIGAALLLGRRKRV